MNLPQFKTIFLPLILGRVCRPFKILNTAERFPTAVTLKCHVLGNIRSLLDGICYNMCTLKQKRTFLLAVPCIYKNIYIKKAESEPQVTWEYMDVEADILGQSAALCWQEIKQQHLLLVLEVGYLWNNPHAFCNQSEKQRNWQSRSKGLVLVSEYTEQLGSLQNKEELAIGVRHILAKNDAACQRA